VDFILEEAGKLIALEITAGSQLVTTDVTGIRAFRDSLKRKASLVRGVVLHGGKARPLDADDVTLPWGMDGSQIEVTCGLWAIIRKTPAAVSVGRSLISIGHEPMRLGHVSHQCCFYRPSHTVLISRYISAQNVQMDARYGLCCSETAEASSGKTE